jgi:outer membrane protein
MRIRNLGVAICAVATTLAGPTLAQTHPAAAAAAPAAKPPIPTGPPIAGLCVFSEEALAAESLVGRFAGQRLGQLKAQSDAELNSQLQAIKTDGDALQAQKATLPQDQLEQKAQALNARYTALQQTAQRRQAELQRTEEKALQRIQIEAQPLEQQAFVQHNCSILLNASGVLFTAPAMDITRQVVTALDAKIQQFQFDREHIDQPAGAPAAQ